MPNGVALFTSNADPFYAAHLTSPCAVTLPWAAGGDVIVWRDSAERIFYTALNYNEPAEGEISYNDQTQVLNSATSASPAVAYFKDNLYIAWKGETGDARIWISNAGGFGSDGVALGLSPQRLGPSPAGTERGPALAATEDTLFMAWKGASSNKIWWSQSQDGIKWSEQSSIPQVGGTSQGPALTAIGDTLFLAWVGEGNDERLFWSKCSDGKTWASQSQIPVGGSGCGPSLAGLADGRLCLVWKGIGAPPGDTRIFYAYLDSPLTNNEWGAQSVIDGPDTDARPTITSTSGGLVWTGPVPLAGLTPQQWVYGPIFVGLLAALAPPQPPPPPPPDNPVLYYKDGKVYGVGFQSNLVCSVDIIQGAGLDYAGPWTGNINYPGIAIHSPCDGGINQSFVVQVTNSAHQSATLRINC